MYHQGDCKLFRVKLIQMTTHKEKMGQGESEIHQTPKDWIYPLPKTSLELMLKAVCK